MRIVFMGTPDFAVPSLEALLQSSHEVIGIVTAPDKPRGRGRKVSGTPVKVVAEREEIPVLQPDSLKSEDFRASLAALHADCFVVVAFRILPAEIFTLPAKGTFNLHASLLPKYRGAAPINWAIINGERESGVTTFFIQEKVDTGNILFQTKVPIWEDTTAGELHDDLAEAGAQLVVQTVDAIENGTAVPAKQDDSQATPAPKIFRETCEIDWSRPAGEVHNHIRGLSPYPGGWTGHNETELKIYKTIVSDAVVSATPGTVVAVQPELTIACGTGAVTIRELKQEGRKTMPVADFLRGYPIAQGDLFQ